MLGAIPAAFRALLQPIIYEAGKSLPTTRGRELFHLYKKQEHVHLDTQLKSKMRLISCKVPFCLFSMLVEPSRETWKHRNCGMSKVRVHHRHEGRSQDITVFTAVSEKTLNYLSCKRKQAIKRGQQSMENWSHAHQSSVMSFYSLISGLYSQPLENLWEIQHVHIICI